MAVYASVEDVAAEFDGTFAVEQIDFIDRKLTSAEIVLRATVGDLTALITSGRTSAAAVKLVLCNMVLRVMRNTEGVRTQTAGPFSYTVDTQVASGRLFVTREDRRLLGLRRGATTITLTDEALPYVHQPPADGRPWAGSASFVSATLTAVSGLSL